MLGIRSSAKILAGIVACAIFALLGCVTVLFFDAPLVLFVGGLVVAGVSAYGTFRRPHKVNDAVATIYCMGWETPDFWEVPPGINPNLN